MIVLRGGKKGFLREKPTVAVKRKYKPRAAAVSKSYVEEATDSDEPTDDNVLPPAKRAKTVPFTIQMGDEDDEIEPLPATSLPPTSDTNTTAPLDQTALSDEANRQNIEQVMDSETRDKTSGATRSATPPLANSMQASQTPTTTPPPEKASKVPKKPRGRPPKSEKPAKPSKQPTTRKPRVPKAPKVPKVPKTKTPPPQATTATHLLKNSQLLITVRHKPRLGDVISLLSLLDPEKQAEATGDFACFEIKIIFLAKGRYTVMLCVV
ncbi:hypothetical protein M7I_0376 [Glarea lozoyensis 74030]|uniref:Uncharacterized protein n=1 Tax=Glarea lozoyensis (strain ATCC 74030 / MF5533) TaxID=1104152 RepID=H0ED75_GLAL7|nr:hypothetical protein M7I_0376 [Glarea lozoyensis 74030]